MIKTCLCITVKTDSQSGFRVKIPMTKSLEDIIFSEYCLSFLV